MFVNNIEKIYFHVVWFSRLLPYALTNALKDQKIERATTSHYHIEVDGTVRSNAGDVFEWPSKQRFENIVLICFVVKSESS